MSAAAELFASTEMTLGEGPIRVGDGDGFGCVDILEGAVHVGDLASGITSTHRQGGTVGAIAETADGRLLAARIDDVVVIGGEERILVSRPADDLRFNDGQPDPVGRFVCGTMADPPRPGAGTLWSFESGIATPLVDGVTISNGLCWSSDGATMFYIDTPTRCVDAFDYDLASGTVSERRTVVRLPDDIGDPDGMAIDCEGGLWVALWGGAAVRRFVDGAQDDLIAVPTPFVTCPAFVGRDASVMLITTASAPNPGTPGAGALYVAEPGVAGLPVVAASTEVVFAPER